MPTNNAINAPLPISLADGGTNASLTASNGGVFYSTAGAAAILPGTATANQMLQSGASSAPAWSTATWPATTTVNQLLYSSSANVVGGLATTASGVLVTSAGGVPSISTAIPNGVTATTQAPGDNTTNIATTAFVIAAGAGGGSTLLASVTAANVATVNFDNAFSGTYEIYMLVFENYLPAAGNTVLSAQFGIGGTPTYQTTGYFGNTMVFSPGSVANPLQSSISLILFQGQSGTAHFEANGYFYISNVNNSPSSIAINGMCNYWDHSSPANFSSIVSCGWQGASPVTSLRFSSSSGNILTGNFYLYGLHP